MKDYRIIEVKESILADNDKDAEELRGVCVGTSSPYRR